MKRIAALPNEIGTAVDVIVRKQARGRGDEAALVTARAVYIAELIPLVDVALNEAVNELRELGKTWREIAELLGIVSAGAAERRFSKTLEDRRKRSRESQALKTPAGLEGVTVTAATRQVKLTPTKVHKLIEANLNNPDATWFIRTPAPTKRGYVDRITDIAGLERAKAQ